MGFHQLSETKTPPFKSVLLIEENALLIYCLFKYDYHQMGSDNLLCR
jgi:hypothetical protein